LCQAQWVGFAKRVVIDVSVEVDSTVESDRVLTQESTEPRVIVAGSIIIEACLFIPFPAREGIPAARSELKNSKSVVLASKPARAGAAARALLTIWPAMERA